MRLAAYQEPDGPVLEPPRSEQPTLLPTPRPDPAAGRYRFTFRGAPWMLVLKNFAREMRMSLHVRYEPKGTLTYFDDNEYTATEAIDILNDYLMPEGVILVRHETKLTVIQANQQVPDSLIPFVSLRDFPQLGRNTLASVAMPIRGVDPKAAVDEVAELLSSVGRARALAGSQRLVVTDTGTYLRRIYDLLSGSGLTHDAVSSHVYRLRNVPAESAAIAINHFLMSRNWPNARPAESANQYAIPESTTNSLLIHGTTAEVADIRSLIERLDRNPPQVLIQALLVEVQLGNTDEFGVELGLQDSVLFDRGVIDNIVSFTDTFQGSDGSKLTSQNVISQTSTPGFNFNNQPLGNNSAANTGSLGGQALSNFGVGRINGDLGFGGLVLSAGSESVSVLLRALSARFKTDVLSRPQIRTLDNHEALIQIGQQVPIVDGVHVTPVGSANPVIRQDKAGIILKVIPRISPDGSVLIRVNAEKSAFQLAPGTGVPIFTDATNGNVIESPVKDVTTANTSVSVQSGQAIVLGGLITREFVNVERKVPWLGEIPVLGRLFRFDLEQSTRKELLIFLTPRIIYDQAFDEHLKSEEISKMCFPHQQAAQLQGDLHDGPVVVDEVEIVPPPTDVPSPATNQDAPMPNTVRPTANATNPRIETSAPRTWQPFATWIAPAQREFDEHAGPRIEPPAPSLREK